MLKNIVFDMGNVIMRWDSDYIAGRLSRSDEEKQIILDELFNSPQWALLDAGQISLDEAVASFTCHHDLLKYALYHWYDYFEPIEKIVPLIKELKQQNYHLYLLSNCSIQFDDYYKKVKAFKYLDGLYISAKAKLVKPDEAIYEDFLNRYHLKAEESLFIDDMEVNVKAARQVGFIGYVYDGNVVKLKQFIEEVSKR